MNSMTSSHVNIQTSPQSVPSTPSWMGEVAVVAHYLIHVGLLEKIRQEMRFSRKAWFKEAGKELDSAREEELQRSSL
jgi:hypothetical protein